MLMVLHDVGTFEDLNDELGGRALSRRIVFQQFNTQYRHTRTASMLNHSVISTLQCQARFVVRAGAVFVLFCNSLHAASWRFSLALFWVQVEVLLMDEALVASLGAEAGRSIGLTARGMLHLLLTARFERGGCMRSHAMLADNLKGQAAVCG